MKREEENNRKLSKAEEKRKAAFEKVKEKYLAEGYTFCDLTIGLVYANVMALVLGLPIVVILGYFFIRWNQDFSVMIKNWNLLVFFAACFVLVFVHELIHGICWACAAKEHWKTISFGFIAQYMTPYCTCSEPLKKGAYITGALMPTILLGVVPGIIAVMNGSILLFAVSVVMIFGGGGDMTIVLKLLRHHSDAGEVIYMDHPYQCGVVAFER